MPNLTLHGLKHEIKIVDPFGDGNELIIYLNRLSDGKRIAYPSIYGDKLDDTQTAIAALKIAVENINEEVAAFYGAPASEKTGRELLEHLIENNIAVSGDKLSVNDE